MLSPFRRQARRPDSLRSYLRIVGQRRTRLAIAPPSTSLSHHHSTKQKLPRSSAQDLPNELTNDRSSGYRSGRWLFNEEKQLAKRYVQFNAAALQEAASNAVGCRCLGIEEFAEGFYNKAFSLDMEDGRVLIAKIPNANARPPNITVQSEAATLEFLRTVLDIPVPKVYAWSTTDSGPNSDRNRNNPVGAEYIIMEKAKGRQLSESWPDMSDAQKSELCKDLVSIEAKLAKARLKRYGSLYFKKERGSCGNLVDDESDQVMIDSASYSGEKGGSSRFRIGQTVERSFWADERDIQDGIDSGPWETLQGYFSAVASREIAWFRQRTSTEPTSNTSIHIQLLEQFLSVLPYVLPKDKFITYPTLWHTDLHADNIFVDPANPSKITDIIDWQSTSASPFFMQARFPSIFDCDWPYPWGTVMPKLPENFDDLSSEEQERARQEYRDVRLKKFYEIASRKLNPLVFRALDAMREEGEDEVQVSTLLAIVGRSWLDGPVPLRAVLVQIFENWGQFSAEKCPIYFSPQEIERYKGEEERWAAAYEEFDRLRVRIEGGKEGWVSNEEYEVAKRRYEESKGQMEELRRRLEAVGGGGG